MSERRTQRLVKEGPYIAEVDVDADRDRPRMVALRFSQDVRKLDDVRLALRRGDLAAAARLGRVYELKPVAAE